MYNANDLKAELVRLNLSQNQLADYLNINTASVNRKINKGTFSQKELEKLFHLLTKEVGMNIFFN